MNGLYINKDLYLLDFSKAYYTDVESLLNGEDFKMFLEDFFIALADRNHLLYRDLLKLDDHPGEYLIRMIKLLLILDLKDIPDLTEEKKEVILNIVEEAYNYYRNKMRFSLVTAHYDNGVSQGNFMEIDIKFNDLILSLYRKVEEKLMDHKNLVYRQLQAGTNATLLVHHDGHRVPAEYAMLSHVPFIHRAMLRTPMILHTEYNKRVGIFKETDTNPIADLKDVKDFYCIPIMVGDSLTSIYFHKDYMYSAIGLVNLFEIAPLSKVNEKPDTIILFGVKDGKEDEVFYYDEKNDLYIAKLSYKPIIEYFGYFKKIALTVHNLMMIKKGMLPIHGAMFNIYFKDGTKKGICLMGDSGAGKSETLEAFSKILGDEVLKLEVIFDDMGTMYEVDGKIRAKGTETGAFIRLDDLGNESIYKDFDRSIFINPESNKNARLILPKTPYDIVVEDHVVDVFLYANNYTDKYGVGILPANEAKEVCKKGIRMALGTTGEKGLSETYFANPFGPMQKQKDCDPIIDKIFNLLDENKILTGEIYTRLSFHDDGIDDAAKELVKIVKGI